MYEARQNKEKVSRTINNGNGVRQRVEMKNETYLPMVIMQYKKNENERTEKIKRVQHAKNMINKYANQFDENLRKHIFVGEKNNGTLTGLHAYVNQALGGNVINVSTEGNVNKVHKITWRWADDNNNNTKQSTMFPKWMPENHVKMLIAIQFPSVIGEQSVPYSDELRTYISHGLNINIEKRGNTCYPTLGNL